MQQYVKTGIKDFKAFPVFLVCKIIMNGNWCTTISSATYVAELTVVFFHFLFFPLISQYNIAKPAIETHPHKLVMARELFFFKFVVANKIIFHVVK
ncbi:MAG: hypothetical protein CMO44_17740 [Verrucomicrobiales bacterium]|nr:hypothetical protein [Verrucomicrobiales bacterium]